MNRPLALLEEITRQRNEAMDGWAIARVNLIELQERIAALEAELKAKE